MADRDYYEILGVSPRASYEEIRSAFRALARQYHPDTGEHGGDVERFQLVQEAWEVLSDPERRAQYDRQRTGGRSRRRRATVRIAAAEPAQYTVVMTPYEAMTGGRLEVPLSVRVVCPSCDGRGRLTYTFCRGCHGRGMIKEALLVPVHIPPGVRDNDVLYFEAADPVPLHVRLHVRISW